MITDNWINLVAAILVGGGTLTLAIMTWKSIKQTRTLHQRERKERWLNEIIGWLKNLEENIFPRSRIIHKEILEEIDIKEKHKISDKIWQIVTDTDRMASQLDSLHGEIKEGKYIQRLASKLNNDLGILIDEILKHLEQRRQLVFNSPLRLTTIPASDTEEGELISKLLEDDTLNLDDFTLSEWGRHSVLMGRNASAIKTSVLNAVDKVVEIKTSLLQS